MVKTNSDGNRGATEAPRKYDRPKYKPPSKQFTEPSNIMNNSEPTNISALHATRRVVLQLVACCLLITALALLADYQFISPRVAWFVLAMLSQAIFWSMVRIFAGPGSASVGARARLLSFLESLRQYVADEEPETNEMRGVATGHT